MQNANGFQIPDGWEARTCPRCGEALLARRQALPRIYCAACRFEEHKECGAPFSREDALEALPYYGPQMDRDRALREALVTPRKEAA